MRKLVFCVAIILCLVLIVPVAWGCSKPKEENTFVKLLRLLPETARDGRAITIINYESIREVNSISLYDEDNQRITREEYIEAFINMNIAGTLFGSDIFQYGSYWTGFKDDVLFSPIQDYNIGYNIMDVNAEINNIYSVSLMSSGIGKLVYNFDALVAAEGNFDAQSTKDALENRGKWPSWAIDNFTIEEYEKTIIYSWGDSLEFHLMNHSGPPHLDEFGRAVPLAVSDGQLFIGSSIEDIKSAIDSSMNKAPSLADILEYVLVAQGMHDLDAIGVIIIDELLIRDILASAEPDFGPQVKNYTTVCVGPGKNDKGEYMALVIVFDNPESAEEGATLLEQRIEVYNKLCNEFYYNTALIYDTEINVEDRVLLAKLYTNDKSLWRNWFFNQWPNIFQAEKLTIILPD